MVKLKVEFERLEITLPLCKLCQKQRVKAKDRTFCGVKCANQYKANTLDGKKLLGKARKTSRKSYTWKSTHPAKKERPLCEWCKLNPVKALRKRFCGVNCAAYYRNSLPHIQEQKRIHGLTILGAAGIRNNQKIEVRAASSERMKVKNPMSNPESVAKMKKSLAGKTFLSRGGNGTLTKPQIMLCNALNLPEEMMEFMIPTATVAGQFPSLPNCYKVDIAIPSVRLAIEVDGSSHREKRWKFLDKRKTEILQALGWTVIRFTNEQVLTSIDDVVKQIQCKIIV